MSALSVVHLLWCNERCINPPFLKLHAGAGRSLCSLGPRANGDRAWLVQRLVDLGFVHIELVKPDGVVHQDLLAVIHRYHVL